MTYTFRTRSGLIKHLRALCELSASIEHSHLPISDFDYDLPYLLGALLLLKKKSIKYSCIGKIYIAFRTTGFECLPTFSSFKSRLSCFTSVIACYSISFFDGYYRLTKFEL